MTCGHIPCEDCREKIYRGHQAESRLAQTLDDVKQAFLQLSAISPVYMGSDEDAYSLGCARAILHSRLLLEGVKT